MERSNIHLYGLPDVRNQRPERPLNVVFLTSVRDVGVSDLNGSIVETRNGRRYMEGAVERVVREMGLGGRLEGLVNLAGVITDDMGRDLDQTIYPALPGGEGEWIFPRNLRRPDGVLVGDLTSNIPSDFRGLHSKDFFGRRRLKLAFEEAVFNKFNQLGGDVLISDHYMAQVDHLYDVPEMRGRVLNIHPAVTMKDHPFSFTGKTPTADAIEYARSNGFTRTGATLHFIGPVIDAGPIIAFNNETPVHPDDDPQWLRHRNYTLGKLPVLVEGLVHYVQNIYPNLHRADLSNLKPVGRS